MNLKWEIKEVRLKRDPREADEKIAINFKEINFTEHLFNCIMLSMKYHIVMLKNTATTWHLWQ